MTGKTAARGRQTELSEGTDLTPADANGAEGGSELTAQQRAMGALFDALIESGARMVGDIGEDRVQVQLENPGDFFIGRLNKAGLMKEPGLDGKHGVWYHLTGADGTAYYLNGSFDLNDKLCTLAADGKSARVKPQLQDHVVAIGLMSIQQLDRKRTLKVYGVIDCGDEFPDVTP